MFVFVLPSCFATGQLHAKGHAQTCASLAHYPNARRNRPSSQNQFQLSNKVRSNSDWNYSGGTRRPYLL
jgi:hypothetical protein